MYALNTWGQNDAGGRSNGFHIDLVMDMDGEFLSVDCRWGKHSPAYARISQLASFPQLVGWDAAIDLLHSCFSQGIAGKELALICMDSPVMVRCLLNRDHIPGLVQCALMMENETEI